MELNFKVFGQGEPLIILHGMFGTLDNWQTLGKQFAQYHAVYLVDQRNHGRSPHTDLIDYPSMAADLKQFLETQSISKTNLLGHSMGGKTAMLFALEYADLVNKLIVVDVAPKRYAGGHEEILAAILSLDLNTIQNRQDAEIFLRERLPLETEGTIQFLMKNLTRKSEGGFEWKMNFPVIYKHYEDILAPVTSEFPFEGETLFVRGGKSNYIRDTDWQSILTLFPNAKLETIADAGHWVHAEQPQRLMQVITGFMAT